MKNEKYQMYENVKSKMLYHSVIGCPAYTQSRLLGEMMMIMVIMLILVEMVILVIIVMMIMVMMAMIKDTLHTQSRPTGAHGEHHPHGRCSSSRIVK